MNLQINGVHNVSWAECFGRARAQTNPFPPTHPTYTIGSATTSRAYLRVSLLCTCFFAPAFCHLVHRASVSNDPYYTQFGCLWHLYSQHPSMSSLSTCDEFYVLIHKNQFPNTSPYHNIRHMYEIKIVYVKKKYCAMQVRKNWYHHEGGDGEEGQHKQRKHK